MKRKTHSFTGSRPIFTGSPSIVQGGFNLDVTNQTFAVGSIIPAGTLAIFDEQTRLVQVIKTAKVAATSTGKEVTLTVDEFYAPCFAVGEYVLKAGTAATAIADVPKIESISFKDGVYKINLSAALSVAAGDVIEEFLSDGASTAKSKERGTANAVTLYDVEVSEFETAIDVCDSTMQFALYERRVPPIPASQKDTTGRYLKNNPHIVLTQSY